MNNMLRTMILAPVVLATAAFTANTAQAETTLKVPFSFTVAGKTCPAGLYTVQHDTARNIVRLQSKNAGKSFTWILAPGDAAPNSSTVTLKFDETGEAHALRSVQYGSLSTHNLDKNNKHSEHIYTQAAQGE